jgi:hypothetical protein
MTKKISAMIVALGFLLSIVGTQIIVFAQSTPTAAPLTASLAESASALNFANKINFTVTVDGGRAPYAYAWYVDDQLVETSGSRYYSTDVLGIGSHHVYVKVYDADNSSAITLANSFEVLPNPAYSPGLSPSVSVPEFPFTAVVFAFLALTTLVGLLLRKRGHL